jgi:hypothetical protein
MDLPNELLNLLRHQLDSPSPLNAISCVSICLSRVSRNFFDIFLVQVRGASRDLRGVQAQRCPVSCLGDTTTAGEQVHLRSRVRVE